MLSKSHPKTKLQTIFLHQHNLYEHRTHTWVANTLEATDENRSYFRWINDKNHQATKIAIVSCFEIYKSDGLRKHDHILDESTKIDLVVSILDLQDIFDKLQSEK